MEARKEEELGMWKVQSMARRGGVEWKQGEG
jgi:hypothetical protein